MRIMKYYQLKLTQISKKSRIFQEFLQRNSSRVVRQYKTTGNSKYDDNSVVVPFFHINIFKTL